MIEQSKWEYRVQSFGSALRGVKEADLEAELNAWGEDGWEVVSAAPTQRTNKLVVVAKRPVSSGSRHRRVPEELY